jgi:mono/diheme cytochrome c family protein
MKRMRRLRRAGLAVLGALALSFCALRGDASARSSSAKESSTTTVIVPSADSEAMRLEGEQRFHANCGRCHAAPQKFPPRMMKTVLRHMRVRATITDQDMRLVLFYMTQ